VIPMPIYSILKLKKQLKSVKFNVNFRAAGFRQIAAAFPDQVKLKPRSMNTLHDLTPAPDASVREPLSHQPLEAAGKKQPTRSANFSKPGRLLSVDALRGFDMLMITGAGALFVSLENKTGWPWVDAIAAQFTHPAWNGFTFYDFIFPLFLFTAGVSLPFSLNKAKEKGAVKSALYQKAFWRMVLLLLLGMLDKNAPFPFFEPSQIRIGSVLGRIGIAGFITALLYLNLSRRSRLGVVGVILVGYYACLFLVPVPGYGAGNLTFEGNLVGWIDRNVLPGRLLQKTYDELGLLTQLPALCLTMLGAMAGDILRSSWMHNRKLSVLSLAGVAAIALALLWSLHFPINKHLWSSSFILLTAGMSFLFLALFYWLIEVLQFRRWAFFFMVVGVNSITIYLAYRFFDFSYTANLLFAGLYEPLAQPWHEVFEAAGALLLVWVFLYFLYRNKIFLKI
jgi:predicted acyltransferase